MTVLFRETTSNRSNQVKDVEVKRKQIKQEADLDF